MPLPRINTDFNGASLDNYYTRKDLASQGIELFEGMRAIFYDLDEQDGQAGFIHCLGTVNWDPKSKVFRLQAAERDFTAGTDLSVLDGIYDE